MPTLHYQTAGESHGPALVTTITGLPAGLTLDMDFINAELLRRQGGYGRGGRQKLETDVMHFLCGVRLGKTIGAPLVFQIPNRDSRLDNLTKTPPVHRPRPGHADLAGSIKWLTTDCRETLERASARETASRVGAGAIARCLLRHFGIEVFGFVRQIERARTNVEVTPDNWRSLISVRNASDTYTLDEQTTQAQRQAIRKAKEDQDTVGGHVECHVFGCPPGIGSSMDWTTKLDARIAYAVMGIQAFKAVQIGAGVRCAEVRGSALHDPIAFDPAKKNEPTLGFVRPSNNAGGTEGGMSNGQPIVVTGTMKPIATLLQGMPSIDLNTKQPQRSQYERSDVCAVSAASVVMENVVAFEVARCLLDKFGGDSMTELEANFRSYLEMARRLPL
ncbi:MAG: chorismate synthase [Leptolyngbya sp. PLA3]|nr:MAG: chorismate synthase [Cyanobacteria bacterium CYA]MCE7969989.1 chorismate synthase [Leptolyngbya sp. PL-A3]